MAVAAKEAAAAAKEVEEEAVREALAAAREVAFFNKGGTIVRVGVE